MHERPFSLSAMGLLYGSFSDVVGGQAHNVFGPGLSLRATLPVLHDGVLPANDSVELEAGVDGYFGAPGQLAYQRWFVGIVPELSARWTFHVTAITRLYVRVGALLDLGVHRPWWPVFAWPSGAIGVLLRTTARIHTRVELGWPGIRAGAEFDVL